MFLARYLSGSNDIFPGLLIDVHNCYKLKFNSMTNQITLSLVLQYLKQNGFIESYLSLENEAKTSFNHYPKEVEFFRKIVMKGDFSKAVQFLLTFERKINEDSLYAFSLQLYKQKLYELLQNPDQAQLRTLFEKQIVNFCTEEEYQQLFTMLTCKSVKEIDGMENWSPMKGRYECFQKIYPTLQEFFNTAHQHKHQHKQLNYTIEDAVAAYLNMSQKAINESQVKMGQSLQNISQISNNLSKSKQQITKSNIGSRKHPSTDKDSIQQKIPIISNSLLNKNESVQNSNLTRQSKMMKKPIGKELQEIELGESQVEKSPQIVMAKSIKGNPSAYVKKWNPYIADGSNPSGLEGSQAENKYSNIHTNQPLKLQDVDDQESQAYNKSKPTYLMDYPKSQNESQMYQQEVRRNIQYLDQNNSSAMYRDPQNQNFTFSHGTEQSGLMDRNRKVLKLASVSDSKAIRTCQFSASGNYFALGTNSSYLKIFQISELFAMNVPRQILPVYQIPQLHSKSIFCLDWSLNEKGIITCSNDLTIKITEFPDGFNYATHKTSNIGRHQSCIRMVKFNSLENKIVSCGDDSLIKIWDIGKNKKCTNLKGHTQSVSGFKFSGEQDSILYSVSKDLTIRKWDLRMDQTVRVSDLQDSQMTYIANHIDRIVVSHKNGCVSFFSDDLQLEHSCQIHQQEIRSIDGLSYDDTLLTASFDGHISLFSEATLESPNYHQHNELEEDKVVYATFLNHPQFRGFASTSTMGLCNIFSYQ